MIPEMWEMPLSAKTTNDRSIKMAAKVTRQQIEDIYSAPAYSICLWWDRWRQLFWADSAAFQVCECWWMAAGRNHWVDRAEGPNTGGGHLWGCGEKKAKKINTTYMMSVATDGAPSMRGAQRGLELLDRKQLTFHCILQQSSLCNFPPNAWRWWTLSFKWWTR